MPLLVPLTPARIVTSDSARTKKTSQNSATDMLNLRISILIDLVLSVRYSEVGEKACYFEAFFKGERSTISLNESRRTLSCPADRGLTKYCIECMTFNWTAKAPGWKSEATGRPTGFFVLDAG